MGKLAPSFFEPYRIQPYERFVREWPGGRIEAYSKR